MNASVIIPTHNRHKKLRALLESLQRQDLAKDDFEVIVIDDGSRDKTKAVVDSFQGQLNIRYAFQQNQGPSAARNHGIRLSQAPIVLFSDDDMLAPVDWVRKFIQAFAKNPAFAVVQAGCVYANHRSIFTESTSYFSSLADKIRILPSTRFSEGREADYIGTGNLAVHKMRLQNIEFKFDERLITREDEDFFRSLKKVGTPIGFIDNALLHKPAVGIIPDIKRFFFYGRGEYHLREKWGNYQRLRYERSPQMVYKVFGAIKGRMVMFIVKLRTHAGRWGYDFEAKQCEAKAKKLLKD